MKVLITGSSGFIGSQLVAECLKRGFGVWGIDLVAKPGVHFYQADIRSRNIHKIIPDNLDVIVHLAALSNDGLCRGRGYECFDTNVLGTLNMMEAAQKCGVKQFIFASSEWVYGDRDGEQLKDENTPINAGALDSEYAFSKFISEVNLRHKYLSGFCSTTILRFGIIYGLRKSGSAVETIFAGVKTQDRVEVNSLRTARRFVHIFDIIEGIIKSIGLSGFNIIGLEGDQFITLKDIIEAAQKVTGRKVGIVESQPELFSIRNVSNNKAKSLLGWRPAIDINTGLKMLYDSYKQNENC